MEIDFFEASSKAGGRLSCFKWNLKSGESFLCDNGQHFVIGAYRNFLAMLETCGALDKWNNFKTIIAIHQDSTFNICSRK